VPVGVSWALPLDGLGDFAICTGKLQALKRHRVALMHHTLMSLLQTLDMLLT
jgi:hypothetical protein